MDSTEIYAEVVSREGGRAAHAYCDGHARDSDFEPTETGLQNHIWGGLLGKEARQRWLAKEARVDLGDKAVREKLVEAIVEEAWRSVVDWGNQQYYDDKDDKPVFDRTIHYAWGTLPDGRRWRLLSVPLREPESEAPDWAWEDRCQVESSPGSRDYHDTDDISDEVRRATRDHGCHGGLRP